MVKSIERLLVIAALAVSATSHAGGWDREAWLDKLEAAKRAEGTTLVQYDAQPNYANWGGITAYFRNTYGVEVPPDMKSSVATLVALLKEQENTVADVAYYNALVGSDAGERRGVHQPYRPMNWERIPDTCKDPGGTWFCVHRGVIGFVVNTEALAKAGVPVPESWADLLDPQYRGLVAYDDPTVHGTAMEAIFAANMAMGGSLENHQPGIDYLKRLDANILRYARETSYNAALSGEIGIWLHADGSGYKMKWEDGGPIEVVIPAEGTVEVPLAMGMVKWAKRPRLARAYLDWLLGPEAQGLWAESYWRPIIPEYMTAKARRKMSPLAGSYEAVIPVPIKEKAAMIEDYRQAWLEQVKRQ